MFRVFPSLLSLLPAFFTHTLCTANVFTVRYIRRKFWKYCASRRTDNRGTSPTSDIPLVESTSNSFKRRLFNNFSPLLINKKKKRKGLGSRNKISILYFASFLTIVTIVSYTTYPSTIYSLARSLLQQSLFNNFSPLF